MFLFLTLSRADERMMIDKIVPSVIQSKIEKNISVLFTPENVEDVFVSLDKSFLKCTKPLRGGVTCIVPAHESGTASIEISSDKVLYSEEYTIRFIDFTMIWISLFIAAALISFISMVVSYVTCMNSKSKYKDEDDDVYEPLVKKGKNANSAAIPINRTQV